MSKRKKISHANGTKVRQQALTVLKTLRTAREEIEKITDKDILDMYGREIESDLDLLMEICSNISRIFSYTIADDLWEGRKVEI